MLLTSATIRQSCRSFASAPVWQSWSSVDGAPVETDCPSRLPSPPRRRYRPRARCRGRRSRGRRRRGPPPPARTGPPMPPRPRTSVTWDGSSLAPLLNRMGSLLPRNWHSHARHGSRQPACRASARCRSRLRRRSRSRSSSDAPAARDAAAAAPTTQGARRPAAHGRDAGDATVACAPRSDSPRRDRRDHPVRRQHHEPVPAPSADGRAAERRQGRGSAAAPDRDRPGGRACPPGPAGPGR